MPMCLDCQMGVHGCISVHEGRACSCVCQDADFGQFCDFVRGLIPGPTKRKSRMSWGDLEKRMAGFQGSTVGACPRIS